jgi:hypothetical protein
VVLKADIDAKFEASITTSDGINSGTTTVDHSYSVDIKIPHLTLDPISTDNIINAGEHKTDLTVTGTTDAGNGQTVTVNVGGLQLLYVARVLKIFPLLLLQCSQLHLH